MKSITNQRQIDKMPIGEAILTITFGILLPCWDVYSDVAFAIHLISEGHINFGLTMLGPMILSILFTIPHWWRIEATTSNRLKTFPLLLLLFWPQYRALRILYLGLWAKSKLWREEKFTINKDVSSVGKIKENMQKKLIIM